MTEAKLLLRPLRRDHWDSLPAVFLPAASMVVVGTTNVAVQRTVTTREEAVQALRDAGLVVTREWLTDHTAHGGGAEHTVVMWHWEV